MAQRKSSSMQYIRLKNKLNISNKPILATYVNIVNKFGAHETYLKVGAHSMNDHYVDSLNKLYNYANEQIDEPVDFNGSYMYGSQKFYKIWICSDVSKDFNELENGTRIEVQFTTDYYIYSWKKTPPKIKLYVSHVNKFSVRKNLSSEEQKTKNYPTYEEDD